MLHGHPSAPKSGGHQLICSGSKVAFRAFQDMFGQLSEASTVPLIILTATERATSNIIILTLSIYDEAVICTHRPLASANVSCTESLHARRQVPLYSTAVLGVAPLPLRPHHGAHLPSQRLPATLPPVLAM